MKTLEYYESYTNKKLIAKQTKAPLMLSVLHALTHIFMLLNFCQAPRCILKTLDEECRFPQVGISVTQNSHILVDISLASCVQGFRFETLS